MLLPWSDEIWKDRNISCTCIQGFPNVGALRNRAPSHSMTASVGARFYMTETSHFTCDHPIMIPSIPPDVSGDMLSMMAPYRPRRLARTSPDSMSLSFLAKRLRDRFRKTSRISPTCSGTSSAHPEYNDHRQTGIFGHDVWTRCLDTMSKDKKRAKRERWGELLNTRL